MFDVMETRRASRELALLALFQLPKKPEKLAKTDLQAIVLAAVRTLADYARTNLKKAEAHFIQVERHLLEHKSKHPDNEEQIEDLKSVPLPQTDQFAEHIDNCYKSISFLKEAVDIPELYWHYNDPDVEAFTLSLITNYINHKDEVDSMISETSRTWNLDRITKIDKGIMRLAVAEMISTSTPKRVVASEAIKLANKYSTQEGVKFVNGLLGDVIEALTTA